MTSGKTTLIERLADAVRRRLGMSVDVLMERFSIARGGLLHVGGNIGSEAEHYHRCGFSRVIWVEGFEEFYNQLLRNIEAFPEQRAYNVLISDVEDQEVEFRVASNTGSSTMFQPGEAFSENFSGVEFVTTKTLRTQRLDTFFEREKVDLSEVNVLVLDVEGAELKALMSLGDRLSGFEGILTEVSVAPNFVGGPLLADLDRFLAPRGFCRKATNIYRSSGDAFYLRSSGTLGRSWTRHSGRLYGLLYRVGYFRVRLAVIDLLQTIYKRLSRR